MEKEELEEIQNREIRQAVKNADDMIKEKRANEIWLLYEDKFNLEDTTACATSSPSIPKPLLIPTHEKVIIGVAPSPSLKEFERAEGLSVEELLELRRKGWVETILAGIPAQYGGLDYMDELIRVSPSGTVRTTFYSLTLAGRTEFRRMLDKGVALFQGRLGDEATEREIPNRYAHLNVLGLREIVQRVDELSFREVEIAQTLTQLSSYFLADPFLFALRKTMTYPSTVRDFAKQFWSHAFTHVYPVLGRAEYGRDFVPARAAGFVPCWLSDVYDDLRVTTPPSLNIDQMETIRKDSEGFIKATKTLQEEIDRTVKERFDGGKLDRDREQSINEKREELRRRWHEDVTPSFKNIKTRKAKTGVTVTGSIVAPAPALYTLKDVLSPWDPLTKLLSLQPIKEIIDPAAESLARWWERNPIHVDFYEVSKPAKRKR